MFITGNDHQIGGMNIIESANVHISHVRTYSEYAIHMGNSQIELDHVTINKPCEIVNCKVKFKECVLDGTNLINGLYDSEVSIELLSGSSGSKGYLIDWCCRSLVRITGNSTNASSYRIGTASMVTDLDGVFNISTSASSTMYRAPFTPSTNATVTDYNNAPYGLVYISDGASNAPEKYCMLLTLGSNGYKEQLAFAMGTIGKIYTRRLSGSSWSAWKSITFS